MRLVMDGSIDLGTHIWHPPQIFLKVVTARVYYVNSGSLTLPNWKQGRRLYWSSEPRDGLTRGSVIPIIISQPRSQGEDRGNEVD